MDFDNLDFVRGCFYGAILMFVIMVFLSSFCDHGFTNTQKQQLLLILEQAKE